MSLIKKAQNQTNRTRIYNPINIDEEVVSLALEYLKGTVSLVSVSDVLNKKNSQTYVIIARALFAAYREGRITIKE